MAKMTRAKLKGIVKECLVELLAVGLNGDPTAKVTAAKKRSAKAVEEKRLAEHRKKFEYSRKQITSKIKKGDYLQFMKNITIYTGPMCNYCEAAKRLLTRNNATFNEINIGKVDGAMDEMIKKANGKRTIPQIFFDDQHIGGYDEVRALEKENKLKDLLK